MNVAGIDVTLLRPLWLLALPVLAVLGWQLYTRRRGLGDWERVANPDLMQAMAALGHVDKRVRQGSFWAGLGAAALTVLALSGPAIERRDTLSFRNLDGVLFLVDASSSVTDDARWPQMLTMGRYGLTALGTRPAGIIVYGGDAYVATDMTLDHLQLGQTFSLIEAGLVPDAGSRPARALDLAATLLQQTEVIAGDVVLFSDGEGLGPASLVAAEAIAATGARLSVVAMGQNAAFATHASVGGGRVFALTESAAFETWLAEDRRTRLERQDYPLLYWRDLGRYLLVLAALPMLFLFRRTRV